MPSTMAMGGETDKRYCATPPPPPGPFCLVCRGQELRRVFDRADTTKSGTLTLDELTAALCRVDPALEESAVSEMMGMLDLEAAGSVSFEQVREESRPGA